MEKEKIENSFNEIFFEMDAVNYNLDDFRGFSQDEEINIADSADNGRNDDWDADSDFDDDEFDDDELDDDEFDDDDFDDELDEYEDELKKNVHGFKIRK